MSDRPVVADVTQTFYDSMASQYDKFYLNWNATTKEEPAASGRRPSAWRRSATA